MKYEVITGFVLAQVVRFLFCWGIAAAVGFVLEIFFGHIGGSSMTFALYYMIMEDIIAWISSRIVQHAG